MPNPALVDELYSTVCIVCEHSACTASFVAKIENAESFDPVDAWAVKAAREAEQLGWSMKDGHTFCALHSTGAYAAERKMIRFNVFGRYVVGVEWRNEEWKPYFLGNEGKRRDAEFVIPTDIPESELGHYLAVLFHESATPDRNEVKRLE